MPGAAGEAGGAHDRGRLARCAPAAGCRPAIWPRRGNCGISGARGWPGHRRARGGVCVRRRRCAIMSAP